MAGGRSSVEAMETMIKQLTKLQQVMEDMKTRVRRDYDSIGSDWDDMQYQKMESEIAEIETALSACYTSLSSCTIKLQGRKRALEDYLQYH